MAAAAFRDAGAAADGVGTAGAATPPSSAVPLALQSVPPPSRITSSEKYQTSVAKKRVLTYFGHLFIFKLLLSVSVKKLL